MKNKEDGKIYVRINAEEIADTFLQVQVNYMKISRKKLWGNNPHHLSKVKHGNHGLMNYQLLTNTKV